MDFLVILFTKLIAFFTGLLGGGTNLPGQIALKLRPQILKYLVRGYHVILVTGTNGKTTTSAMLQNILRQTGKRAINSTSGANMKGGVVSCLIREFPLFRKVKGDYAVLEVDEAYVRHITAEIKPEIIAVTNIFRDQLDRYGETGKTLLMIEEGCRKAPDATLVLNADEPLLGGFMPEGKRCFYGFGLPIQANVTKCEEVHCPCCRKPLQYSYMTLNHLGAYVCAECGFKRPALTYAVDGIHSVSADCSQVTFSGTTVNIMQAGAYNIYNALCAAACASALGVSNEEIAKGIAGQKSKFGRQEDVQVENANVRIILIKNPVGASEAIASVLPDKERVSVGVILNDNVGDGTDVSWIYDVDFSALTTMNYEHFYVGGTRVYDMAVRMKVTGIEPNVCTDYEALLNEIEKVDGRVYLFVTYSAMIGFRKLLHSKKYIKKLWF